MWLHTGKRYVGTCRLNGRLPDLFGSGVPRAGEEKRRRLQKQTATYSPRPLTEHMPIRILHLMAKNNSGARCGVCPCPPPSPHPLARGRGWWYKNGCTAAGTSFFNTAATTATTTTATPTTAATAIAAQPQLQITATTATSLQQRWRPLLM